MPLTTLLHWATISLLNASLAWLTGTLFAHSWLTRAKTTWTSKAVRQLDSSVSVACLICAASSLINLWIAAAAMGDVPIFSAWAAFQTMILSTNYGQIGILGVALLALFGVSYRDYQRPSSILLEVRLPWILLAAFMLTRAATSHAAESGLFSLAVTMEWLHVASFSCWVGIVIVAAFIALPQAKLSPIPEYHCTRHFLVALSSTATVALVGVGVSGIYNAIHGLRNLTDFASTSWGQALSVKLCLIGVAIVLGGFNRFAGFPAVINAVPGESSLDASMQRLKNVLYVESILLLGAIIVAAILAGEVAPALS